MFLAVSYVWVVDVVVAGSGGCAAVAAVLVYVLVLLFSIFSPAQLLPLLVIRVSGFGVVR